MGGPLHAFARAAFGRSPLPAPPAVYADIGPPPPGARRLSLLAPWLLVAAPLLISGWHDARPLGTTAALVVVAAGVVLASRARTTLLAATIVGVVVLLAAAASRNPTADRALITWLVPALAVGWPIVLGVGRLRDGDRWSRSGTLWPALAPLALASAQLALGRLELATAFAVVALVASSPGVDRRLAAIGARRPGGSGGLHRALARAGRAVGAVLGALAMVPVAVGFTVVWAFHRLLRVDVFAVAPPGRSRWITPLGPDQAPRRAFAARPRPKAQIRGLQVRRIAAGLLTTAVLGTAVGVGVSSLDLRAPDPAVPTEMATGAAPSEGDPIIREETEEYERSLHYDPQTLFRIDDFHGTTINVTDGVRQTWSPPPCGGCERLTIWWFGGSAAWGYLQRDDHSLPSQLAKQAWEAGYALDIVNHANSGFTMAQEVQQFGRLLVTEPHPDAAVFYDGYNELLFQAARNDRGQGSDTSSASSFEQQMDTLLRRNAYPDPATGEVLEKEGSFHRVSTEEVADIAVTRYGQDVQLARYLGEAADVPVVAFWQPTSAMAPPSATVEGSVPEDEDRLWRELVPLAVARLPDEVIDLSGIYDDAPDQPFLDAVHTDEDGAAPAAAALLEHLEPTLDAALRR